MEKSEAKGSAPAPDQTNFQLLKAYFSNAFIKYFESISGHKSVFFDEGLLKVLSFVIGNPPSSAKISETLVLNNDQAMPVSNETVIFVVRPEIQVIKNLIYQKSTWLSERDFYILFVPRRTIECDELLDHEKLFNEDKISQIAMDLVPLEDDLLSLELADNFAHYMLGDDDSYKVYVQNSINRIEQVFGSIKYKYGKGDNACQILNRIKDAAISVDGSQASGLESEIDCLMLIDRNIDLISPFCVNQTYEGLIDEQFGIKSSSISVDTTIVKPETANEKSQEKKDIMLLLTNEDDIFKEVRDKHFSTLENVFSKKCQQIQNVVKEKDAPQSIEQLEAYIQKLRNMNIAKGKDMLTHHINLAYYINNQMKNLDYSHCYGLEQKIILGEDIKSIISTLENKMTKQYSKNKILRLFCLLSVTQSGLKKEDFDYLRKFYIMNYGYQEMITLMNLQDAKLLRPKDKKIDWNKLKKVFKLINEETRIADPIDISYVYNGYSPLSVKLIESMMSSYGFKNIEDKLKILPGAQMSPINEHELFQQQRQIVPQEQQRKKRILVYYIGGITYGEIAAIRFLNKLFKDKKFIIATTQIINGESAIDMVRGKIKNNIDLLSLIAK